MAHLKYFAATVLMMSLTSLMQTPVSPQLPQSVPDLSAAINERVAGAKGVAVVAAWIDGQSHGTIVTGSPASGERPFDSQTIFEIGSVTKTFTGALLGAMVAQGEVALNTTVGSLLPQEVAVPSATGKITLLDLATQRSGLPRLPTNIHPSDINDPYADYRLSDLWAFLRTYKLPGPVGAQYEYSNVGFALLGNLLALRADTPYRDLLSVQVLKPLSLNSTFLDDKDSSSSRLARPHDADGVLTEAWHDDATAPAGALHSDISDMGRYLSANMDPPSNLIGTALSLAQQPRAPGASDSKIALAWNVSSDGRYVWHNGATGGFWAFVGFDKTDHRGIVIMTNRFESIDDIAWHFLDSERPLKPPEPEVAIPSEILDQLPGVYVAGDVQLVVRRVDGALSVQRPNSPSALLHQSIAGDFFLRVDSLRFSIAPDRRGRYNEIVVVSRNGLRTSFKRL